MSARTAKRMEDRPVAVLSGDAKLIAVLHSALSSEYRVVRRNDEEGGEPLISAETGALLADIDSISEADLVRTLKQAEVCRVPVIVVSGDEKRAEALRLVENGAHGYVRKPPALRELRRLLRQAFDGRSLQSELETARYELQKAKGLDGLIGAGPGMQRVYELVGKVADLDASVLITGESGTGKDLIARAIHNTGRRAPRPFVAVSCGAIPETLIESELFGHERGAFTGSTGAREGYFEKAGDGTLFLDEIGELSPQIQVKLLRALQQREFNRLGSSRPVPLRARIVLATHRELSAMVAAGLFRQDLFYRVNVMKIHAPALRSRREDIPLLTRHFMQKYAAMHGKAVESMAADALDLLQNYAWPGNVRELENVVQRALIMADGYTIEVRDLPETFYQGDTAPDATTPEGTFERLVQAFKVRVATEAVEQCNGNKSLAAESLSISRTYLYRLLAGSGTKDAPVVEMETRRARAATGSEDG